MNIIIFIVLLSLTSFCLFSWIYMIWKVFDDMIKENKILDKKLKDIEEKRTRNKEGSK